MNMVPKFNKLPNCTTQHPKNIVIEFPKTIDVYLEAHTLPTQISFVRQSHDIGKP